MRVNCLADLKRLPIGTKLRLVECLMGPVPEEKQGRILAKVQSNAVAFLTPKDNYQGHLSWLHLPPAKQFVATSDGFTVLEDTGEVAARYVFDD